MKDYEVIVIGGGHSGSEAAHVTSALGFETALITLDEEMIGEMPCNPAIGGLAKGHLVKEIDAMGGIMGLIADRAGIQFRTLNKSKGPAVQSPRAQSDKALYRRELQKYLRGMEKLDIIEGEAVEIAAGEEVEGVVLSDGREFSCDSLVLTTGTFLNGLIHVGLESREAGRYDEKPAAGLSSSLKELGFRLGRLKTGTPARVREESVDWDVLTEQAGQDDPEPFSWRTDKIENPLISCYMGYTNAEVHSIIENNLDRSPIYTGVIDGTGPRYCPSIEDKVMRFSDRDRHQIFLEPEGLETDWIYLNGISSSLPSDVQDIFLRKIEGLEEVDIIRYGYAVEYDFLPPTQLKPSLETKKVNGLFTAGQINGTSGYEEAAAQGLMAGINSVKRLKNEDPLVLDRSRAYIGVLIDDLVTKGTSEPYRMFTSRAEYRLLLGTDSADRRLTDAGYELGLIPEERKKSVDRKYERIENARAFLKDTLITPSDETQKIVKENLEIELTDPASLEKLLRRPEVSLNSIADWQKEEKLEDLNGAEREILENMVKYEGYIERQKKEVKKMKERESKEIPSDFCYDIPGLSNELVEKLKKVRPENLGRAGRIPGMTPAALNVISIYIDKKHN